MDIRKCLCPFNIRLTYSHKENTRKHFYTRSVTGCQSNKYIKIRERRF
nr:MAG TPA: hypothetical protein [Bacteriophage sp.]